MYFYLPNIIQIGHRGNQPNTRPYFCGLMCLRICKQQKMKVDVILGLQWGDEGKGKIVDVLTPRYDAISRFQGGPNAGHTLEINDLKHVLHSIPSGIFHESKVNIIGNGVVLDPIVFKKEIEGIEKLGIDLHKNLYISKKGSPYFTNPQVIGCGFRSGKR